MHTPFFSPHPTKRRQTKLAGELNDLRKRRLVQLTFPDCQHHVLLESISLDLKIILCAYIRSCANEGLNGLQSIRLEQQTFRLSPSKDFSCNLIERLYRKNIIQIDAINAPLSCFDISQDSSVKTFVESAIFYLNLADSNGKLLSLKDLSLCIENNLVPRTQNDIDRLEELWKELALQESLEYLNFVMSKRDFPFKPGEKTKSVFAMLLTKFSTSQVFYFIYAAAKNTSDFYQSEKVSKHHAANTVPGKIQRLFDLAISENWKIKKYSRNYKACPPSSLNNVLYDKVLGLAGIDYVPGSVLPVLENNNE